MVMVLKVASKIYHKYTDDEWSIGKILRIAQRIELLIEHSSFYEKKSTIFVKPEHCKLLKSNPADVKENDEVILIHTNIPSWNPKWGNPGNIEKALRICPKDHEIKTHNGNWWMFNQFEVFASGEPEKIENHDGMIYNPYTDTYNWL